MAVRSYQRTRMMVASAACMTMVLFGMAHSSSAGTVVDAFRGHVLLQAEANDQAWYVSPKFLTRFSIATSSDFASVVRRVGIGVSNSNLAKIPVTGMSAIQSDSTLRRQLAGYFVVQVQDRGQIWYVDPVTRTRQLVDQTDPQSVLSPLATRVTDGTLDLIPTSVNLDVPFTTQAPNGKWDADHNEFCEETSVLMAVRYVRGQSLGSANQVEAQLQSMKRWELQHLGHHYDTSMAETARIAQSVYGVRTKLVRNPTAQQLRDMLDGGHPVIVPAAGRQLGNPFFRRPGPDYHVFVLRGYTTDGRFIVNDPGTQFGKNYLYSEATLMRALHDYNNGHPETGAKVIIEITV